MDDRSIPRPGRRRFPGLALVALVSIGPAAAAADSGALRGLSPDVLSPEERAEAAGMIRRDIRRRTAEANDRDRREWSMIDSREKWESYRDERIERLRRSLGEDRSSPGRPEARVTGTVRGDGFVIENIAYESRPGGWVPGNLYAPSAPRNSMPGILIAHSHHRDKTQAELQDMGMTWARAGCLVLVIDAVGYGERRTHPFSRAGDFPTPYPVGRQDYYFRYDTGIQLQLLGESLMGWMALDLIRGVDLLLSREGIDPRRIIILGAVAGGGDPAAVAAALDRRVACCVPFNFGGPQPETPYPLPADAEASFDYLGGTYWDSTRGLRMGGRDGFPHWLIVASTAPRRLIHAHEFSWDGDRDPVWKRYRKIWETFYSAPADLGFAHGTGLLTLQPPEASHCTNIGRLHRRMIHPLLERWFGIAVREADEYSAPRKPEELVCLTPEARRDLQPRSPIELMREAADDRIARARRRIAAVAPAERRGLLRDEWSRLLGPIGLARPPVVKRRLAGELPASTARVERLVLETEPCIAVPAIILIPVRLAGRAPVVVCLAQAGKARFLAERGPEIAHLLEGGAIAVLPDLRGTGESRAGGDRGPTGEDTDLSVHLQLFGETLLGERLRDLRSVLAYLRTRDDVDARRIALWGDSFAPPNPPGADFKVPRGIDGGPRISEPLGGLLALLGTLYEDEVRAVYIARGLAGYRGVLGHFEVLIPHDASVPGALEAGDLPEVAACLAPRPLRLEAMVDGMNRPISAEALREEYGPALELHASVPDAISFSAESSSPAAWLLDRLRG